MHRYLRPCFKNHKICRFWQVCGNTLNHMYGSGCLHGCVRPGLGYGHGTITATIRSNWYLSNILVSREHKREWHMFSVISNYEASGLNTWIQWGWTELGICSIIVDGVNTIMSSEMSGFDNFDRDKRDNCLWWKWQRSKDPRGRFSDLPPNMLKPAANQAFGGKWKKN